MWLQRLLPCEVAIGLGGESPCSLLRCGSAGGGTATATPSGRETNAVKRESEIERGRERKGARLGERLRAATSRVWPA